MQIRKKAGAIDGSLQCTRRRLLAISASKQVELFYRTGQRATKVTEGLRKIAFCGSNLPDGCPVLSFSERH